MRFKDIDDQAGLVRDREFDYDEWREAQRPPERWADDLEAVEEGEDEEDDDEL